MKKLLIVLILLPLVSYGQFDNGYSDGWKEGYCYGKGIGCIAPVPPIAPIPDLIKGEDFTYKSGYSRGLLDGKAANSEGNSSRSKEAATPAPQKTQKSSSGNDNSAAAAGQAIYIMRINNNKKKLEENSLMYEIEPSVETAFEIAKSAKMLFNAGAYENRFGPISKEHKLLIVKYKGKYKKYLKSLK